MLAFIAGSLYAVAVFWLGGGLLYGAAGRLGSEGWRRSRQVLALAATPLALSLLTFWPVRIAVYGQDLFRTGGDDYGRGDAVFGGVYLGFVAWSVLLLLDRRPHRARLDVGEGGGGRRARRRVSRAHRARDLALASNPSRSSSGIAYVCCSSGNAPLRTSSA